MRTVAAIGECMAELTHRDDHLLRLDYAGDSFNTAVYLARSVAEDVRVEYVTRVGDDWYSDQAVQRMAAERLGTTHVERVLGRELGLYLVRTDSDGERSFVYHRSQAPARGLFGSEHPTDVDRAFAAFDLVYLSAITLQILTESARERLWRVLARVRAAGGQVAFDSNYRPAGWPDADAARAAITRMLALTDIGLPSLADERALFGDADALACADRLRRHGVGEIVVKDGANPCLVFADGDPVMVPASDVGVVVDTTAAGDSFSGGYLAARLREADPVAAAYAGHRLAADVIQHPGAITPARVRT
jgi:2-dehydro-3-deoxygluconokinase